ncbi:hypothetical protein L2K70_09235 [Nocardioides KLBMP 9356]|uniref:Cobyrinic acid a,c-diamide synthase n=1 Tax=Nocardioides potassii TaxID=2911371 RepID=A0ABS9HBQ3_9ACTN|nr:hypothetical protein [Nocardioides potassii]MCF6377788.1 hypothetical protein [Nocardioides potassii]
MARRVSMPAADDLFRPTTGADQAAPEQRRPRRVRAVADDAPADAEAQESGLKRPSGRVRHDEKMTVYVTADELLDIEHARLTLRRHHGLAVDRGRLVREALALVLADLEAQGTDSALVQRLLDE